jgi:uncharacterized membrane protein YfcA
MIAFCSLFAGVFGALTGLGGGMIIVPILVLYFGIDVHHAAGAALIAVIAASCAASIEFLKGPYTNIRIGVLLEVATTLGAIFGAHLASILNQSLIAVLFGIALIYASHTNLDAKTDNRKASSQPDYPFQERLAQNLKLAGNYLDQGKSVSYSPNHLFGGFSLMALAGTASGLLGIGSGAFKVFALDRVMNLPFKVSTTTSNFMIGVTAAAGSATYFSKGYIEPTLALPVLLGVTCGGYIGARLLARMKVKALRVLFTVGVFVTGIQMLMKGFAGAQ